MSIEVGAHYNERGNRHETTKHFDGAAAIAEQAKKVRGITNGDPGRKNRFLPVRHFVGDTNPTNSKIRVRDTAKMDNGIQTWIEKATSIVTEDGESALQYSSFIVYDKVLWKRDYTLHPHEWIESLRSDGHLKLSYDILFHELLPFGFQLDTINNQELHTFFEPASGIDLLDLHTDISAQATWYSFDKTRSKV